MLQQDDNRIDDITNELYDWVIEDHLKYFKNNILASVPRLKDSLLESVPELYFDDFVAIIASHYSGDVNTKILASILKLLIADKVYQPIFLHTYWWKNSNGILAQLQLSQMAPEINQNIEDQGGVIAEKSLERHLVVIRKT